MQLPRAELKDEPRLYVLPTQAESLIFRFAKAKQVAKSKTDTVRLEVTHYLNRLCDLLFVLCRVLGRASGYGEVQKLMLLTTNPEFLSLARF
jgi:hypothetical protein